MFEIVERRWFMRTIAHEGRPYMGERDGCTEVEVRLRYAIAKTGELRLDQPDLRVVSRFHRGGTPGNPIAFRHGDLRAASGTTR
jgi:hypothetical protein